MRTLAEWLALQESVHPQTIDMGLTRVTSVARALGVDKPACPVITVGGTNGKGSTVAHLEAFLRAAGASTGMFTSPHFIRYNERIRVDGLEAADEELIAAFERIEAARGTTTLTFFEYNTLAALLIFAQRAVDVAILEVGLGGRLDATNLVDADVGVVCSIGFDHRDWLGDSLELIGAEKAGIFRGGRPAVLGTDEMPASVYARIGELGARPVVAGKDFKWHVDRSVSAPASGSAGAEAARTASGAAAGRGGASSGAAVGGATAVSGAGVRWSYDGLQVSLRDLPPSALPGSIQYRNASTAIAALEALQRTDSAQAKAAARGRKLDLSLDQRVVSTALGTVRLAGRFQIVPGSVEWILDIAHNEPAAEVFARHVRERPLPRPSGRTLAVVGILGDKDARAIADAVRPLVDHWFLCALPGPRGGSAGALAERLQLPEGSFTLAPSVEAGCEAAREFARAGDRVIVFGSVYTVGPALQWLRIY